MGSVGKGSPLSTHISWCSSRGPWLPRRFAYSVHTASLVLASLFQTSLPQSLQGKANRVPETEEERAVRLEAEALAAREGARRREEAARLRLRERQMREQVRDVQLCLQASTFMQLSPSAAGTQQCTFEHAWGHQSSSQRWACARRCMCMPTCASEQCNRTHQHWGPLLPCSCRHMPMSTASKFITNGVASCAWPKRRSCVRKLRFWRRATSARWTARMQSSRSARAALVCASGPQLHGTPG